MTGYLNPDASGGLKRTFVFEGELLVLGLATLHGGVPVTRGLEYKRDSGTSGEARLCKVFELRNGVFRQIARASRVTL